MSEKPPVKSYCGGVPNYCTPVDAVNMSQERVDETAKGEHIRCIVKDCPNHIGQGRFVGNLCSPCHDFLSTGNGVYSQAYRNTKREWVGLTDDDVHDAFNYVEMVKLLDFDRDRPEWCEAFASACEARLRHKNGGNK